MNEKSLKQFETALLAEITRLNGEITDGGLNMAIMECILEEKLKELELNREAIVEERLYSEIDDEAQVENSVYVYDAHSKTGLLFDAYTTIADAVRAATKLINASVIYNGNIIYYDTLDDDKAYYVDEENHKVKIVNL